MREIDKQLFRIVKERDATTEFRAFVRERGADVNAVNDQGEKPIHVAAENGREDIIGKLIEMGVKVDETDKKGRTPLYYAAQSNHSGTMEFLLQRGAEVNGTDKEGRTPLYYAAQKGNLGAVKFLVGKEAEIGAKNIYGTKPIHVAAFKGHIEIVRFFLIKAANINDTAKYDLTPLHYAAEGGQLEMVRFLVENGANVHAKDIIYGKEPMHSAARKGHNNIIDFFLNNKITKVDDTDKEGHTSLHYATQGGHLGTVRFLVGKGADIKAENIKGVAPIHTAVERGYTGIVEYLLAEDISVINNTDKVDDTPLHYAVRYSKLAMVKLFVGKGADINAKNASGAKPVDIASNPSDIFDFLKSKEGNTTDLKNVSSRRVISADWTLSRFSSESSGSMTTSCSGTDDSMSETGSQLLSLKRRADVLEQQPVEYETRPKLSKVDREEAKEQCIAEEMDDNSRAHLQDFPSASGTTPNIHERSSKTPISSFLQPPQSNLGIEQTRRSSRSPRPPQSNLEIGQTRRSSRSPIHSESNLEIGQTRRSSRSPRPPQSCLEDTNVEQGGKGGKGGKEPRRL